MSENQNPLKVPKDLAEQLEKNLEALEKSMPIDVEDLEPGQEYVKTTGITKEMDIGEWDPETGLWREYTTEETVEKIIESKNTNYYNKISIKCGQDHYDPLRGWTKEDVEDYEHNLENRIDTSNLRTEWGRMMPLTETINRPEFPIDALPAPYKDYVKALSNNIQVPVDMVGVAVLGILGGCLQKRYEINAIDKFTVPLGLYTLIVAAPGERKSAVFDEVVRPIAELEAKLWKDYEATRQEIEIEKTLAEDEFKKIKREILKIKKLEDREPLKAELISLKAKIEACQKKRPPSLYMDDTTKEALEQELARNGGRMIIMSDEGDLFTSMMGLYTGGVHNISTFLKGHSASSGKVHRVGREPVYLPKSNLSILLMVQPVVIESIMNDVIMRGRGMNARFLYTYPQSMVGDRSIEDAQSVPLKVDADYYNAIRSLYEDNYITEDDKPKQITLEGDAQTAYINYESILEHRQKGDMKDISDWGSKLGGEMLRLVGILHCAKHPNAIMETKVATETVHHAYRLARYFGEYARIIYNLGQGMDPNMKMCQRILNVIKGKEFQEFDKTTFFQADRMGMRKPSELTPYLNILEDYGYLRSITYTNGKRTFLHYTVNPGVYEDQEKSS